jgi:hypothetical protein
MKHELTVLALHPFLNPATDAAELVHKKPSSAAAPIRRDVAGIRSHPAAYSSP